MKKNRGGTTTILVALIAIAAMAGTALLVVETLKRRSIEKGLTAFAEGDFPAAAEHLERAAKYSLRPDAPTLLNLARAQYALGEAEKAKASLREAEDADPADAEAKYELGKIFIEEKNYGAAKKEIEALEALGTDEAKEYAQDLKEAAQSGAVKGVIDDFLRKILPRGVPDMLKNALPGGGTDE